MRKFLEMGVLWVALHSSVAFADLYSDFIDVLDSEDIDAIEGFLDRHSELKFEGDGLALWGLYDLYIQQIDDQQARRVAKFVRVIAKRGADATGIASSTDEGFELAAIDAVVNEWAVAIRNKVALKVKRTSEFFDLLFSEKLIPMNYKALFFISTDEVRRFNLVQFGIAADVPQIRDYFLAAEIPHDALDDTGWNSCMTAAALADTASLEALKRTYGSARFKEMVNFQAATYFRPTVLHVGVSSLRVVSLARAIAVVEFLLREGAVQVLSGGGHDLVREAEFWASMTPAKSQEFASFADYLRQRDLPVKRSTGFTNGLCGRLLDDVLPPSPSEND